MEDAIKRELKNGIGRCDICGIVTHNLVEGLCAVCEARCSPCKDCNSLQKIIHGVKCKLRSLLQ